MEGRGYVAWGKLASLRDELGADFSNVCNCEEETGRDYYMYIRTCTFTYMYMYTVHVQCCTMLYMYIHTCCTMLYMYIHTCTYHSVTLELNTMIQ